MVNTKTVSVALHLGKVYLLFPFVYRNPVFFHVTHTYQLTPKSIEFCNFWQGQVNSFFNFELEFLLFLNLFLLNRSSTNELEDLLLQLFSFFSALFLEHFLQLRLLLSIAPNSMDKKKNIETGSKNNAWFTPGILILCTIIQLMKVQEGNFIFIWTPEEKAGAMWRGG